MPDSLETRVRNGVLAAAMTASGGNVPDARHYGRDVLAYSTDRDGKPAVVVARTPGRTITRTPKLQWNEFVIPVTAMLVDATGGTFASGAGGDWRTAWVDALFDALDTLGLPDVAEVNYVDPDQLVQLDLTAFEQAGLWQTTASLLVTVRVPY